MGLNVIKDYKNYRFTLECFKMLAGDPGMNEIHPLKYKRRRLFTAIGIDKEIPPQFVEISVFNKLALLDEAMTMMNMSGLFRITITRVLTDNPKNKDWNYYRVLFIPNLHWSTHFFTLVYLASIIAGSIYAFKHFF